MQYLSTRGISPAVSFEVATLSGLADDGGLFVPQHLPFIDFINKDKNIFNYSFQEVFLKVISLFVSESEIPHTDLKALVAQSFKTFRVEDVVDVVSVDNFYLVELFHGPTFAFKDVALQFLGNLFEYFLTRREKHTDINKYNDYITQTTIVGATSGDTGSAAICGLRGKKNVEVFILFPYGRVSPIQELQMTTVTDANVHCLSVKGTFDDCQAIVKHLFNDQQFKKEYSLGAINSINLVRILAQITYYVYSYILLFRKKYLDPDQLNSGTLPQINFSVPTGNSGDILAGFYAKRMGLPINKLFLCTNKNNTLHHFFVHGHYERSPEVFKTLSPSMDIQVASNFERYLFFLSDGNHELLRSWMNTFEKTGKLRLPLSVVSYANEHIHSADVSEEETISTISDIYRKCQYVVCPHTAVGIQGGKKICLEKKLTQPLVCLATAHPAKFVEAQKIAFNGNIPPTPAELVRLFSMPTKVSVIENDLETIKQYIKKETELNRNKKWSSL